MDAREHQVRGGGADIDADGGELDVVGGPGHLVDGRVLRTDVEMLEFEIVHGNCGRDQCRERGGAACALSPVGRGQLGIATRRNG